MNLEDFLKIKGSKVINDSLAYDFSFTINTNVLKNNSFFIPLKGSHDGHDYILNGVRNGIKGFFTEKGHDDIVKEALEINSDLLIIEVKDTLLAMQELARIVRNKIKVPVIALTGSFGKTSQREMIYSVLKVRFNVLTTSGNYNNHIGMPLTLINYRNEDVVLLELGSNHMGEIAFLRDICRPTISLVTNVGTAHIGNFKNLRNTFKEKTSIVKGCEYFLRNCDNGILKRFKAKCHMIDYGESADNITNVIIGKKIRYTYEFDGKRYKVTVNSDIRYLINYSLCALHIGLLLNMDMKSIIKGISDFRCAPSRMEKICYGKNYIINDCYNASYETMISGLDYFYKQKSKNKIVIIGDILELGRKSKKIHLDIAKYIYKNSLDFKEIHIVGKEMLVCYKYLMNKGFNVYYYKCVDEVDRKVLNNHNVYLKASHGVGLDKLIKEGL